MSEIRSSDCLLTGHAMSPPAHAVDDDRLALLVDLDRAGESARNSTCNGTADGVIVFGFAQGGSEARAQAGGCEALLIELFLVAGERLTSRKVRCKGS